MMAIGDVAFDPFAKSGGNVAFEVGRDLFPNLAAGYLDL